MQHDDGPEILQRVQRPAKLIFDRISGRHFLGSDFNKVAAAYRSPWCGAQEAPNFWTSEGELAEGDEVPAADRLA